jgi:hypothetical protein
MNNSAPIIDSFFPNITSFSIIELNTQTFNISASDPENSTLTTSWYLNGALQSIGFEYNFTGNYSSAGLYNITAAVSDGFLSTFQSWNLTVNNTNQPPQVQNITLISSDSLNRTNGTLQAAWNFSDSDEDNQTDNETKWYNNSVEVTALANLTSITSGNTTKNQSWIFSVRVYDNSNWSIWYNSSNLTIQNTAPNLTQISNITATENDLINITINATDIDNDSLTYFINDTRFNHNFTWQTTSLDSGTYIVNITVSDNTSNTSQLVHINISELTDNDNDGINDTIDYLIGSSPSSSTMSLSIAVNGSTNLSQAFNNTLLVKFTNTTNPIVEFNWTFNSTNKLNLAAITIEKQTGTEFGSLIVKGLNPQTKTVYVDNLNQNLSTICIKDAEITSIDNISSGCNGANETLITCNGIIQNGYNCTNMTGRYKITGLSHSGIKEQCADADGDGYGTGCQIGNDCDDSSSSVNPGASEVCGNNIDDDCDGSTDEGCAPPPSGGGSSSRRQPPVVVCTESWSCTGWSECIGGMQVRACTDLNNCGTIFLMPDENQFCIIPEEIIKEEPVIEEEILPTIEKPLIKIAANDLSFDNILSEPSILKQGTIYIVVITFILLFTMLFTLRREKKRFDK